MELTRYEHIENKIYAIKGVQVMLDSDLSMLDGTETKFINRAMKRNLSRFPEPIVFQHSQDELESLRFQSGTLSGQGVVMLSALLLNKLMDVR
jgi:hypothetical protein